MHRRTLLGTLAAELGTLLARVSGPTISGGVAENPTPLSLVRHEGADESGSYHGFGRPVIA
ncbi:hypothetical protein [Haloarcula marina]|uniref:hypothetical protein n=1 Tax=Haloarcula marina TaxID=2961574 RepID=UPI0020B7CE97|nr:hypothetical protein [Halomicroarcula marina]